MTTVRCMVHTEAARAKLQQVQQGLTREVTNSIVQRVGLQMFAEIVAATPVRWFGAVRAAWRFIPTQSGSIIRNDSKVFRFLDQGTKDHGPVQARFLYVPLTKQAASGWRSALKRGIDYILTKKVRGIKALRLIDRFRARSRERMLIEFKNHIRQLLGSDLGITQPGLVAPIPSVLSSSSPLASGLATQVPIALLTQPKIPFSR